MTVWRDVQALAVTLRRPPLTQIRVLGLDGFYTRLRGVDTGMLIAVALGTGTFR